MTARAKSGGLPGSADTAMEEAVLFGTQTHVTRVEVELDFIDVKPEFNPRGAALGRSAFRGEAFDDLVRSVREQGVLQTLLLRPRTDQHGRYWLVAGERRLEAARKAGLTHVPADIRELTDDQAWDAALAENDQREDLGKLDRVHAVFRELSRRTGVNRPELRGVLIRLRNLKGKDQLEPGSLEDRVAAVLIRMGQSENTLIRHAQLLDLSPEELDAVRDGVPERVVLALLKLRDHPERPDLLCAARAGNWTQRQMEDAVQARLGAAGPTLGTRARTALGRAQRLAQPGRLARLGEDRGQAFVQELEALLARYEGTPEG